VLVAATVYPFRCDNAFKMSDTAHFNIMDTKKCSITVFLLRTHVDDLRDAKTYVSAVYRPYDGHLFEIQLFLINFINLFVYFFLSASSFTSFLISCYFPPLFLPVVFHYFYLPFTSLSFPTFLSY
jgi:hypothetical protein